MDKKKKSQESYSSTCLKDNKAVDLKETTKVVLAKICVLGDKRSI